MKVFDREGDDGKFVSVTVKATDHGEPALEGVCSFTVELEDQVRYQGKQIQHIFIRYNMEIMYLYS